MEPFGVKRGCCYLNLSVKKYNENSVLFPYCNGILHVLYNVIIFISVPPC